MQFAITLKPDISVERIVGLARQAEDAGFEYGWMFDSHVIWKECFPLMTLIAANTRRLKIGTCVTNPAVRDVTVASSLFATLNIISGGRMVMGIGRGDSSRRVLGKKPTTLERMEDFIAEFRALTTGGEVQYDGRPTRLPWTEPEGAAPEVWVAGYGPKALACAGRVGDGVILQFADPDLIEWCLTFVRKGAEEAGRDFRKIKVMAAAPVWVSDDTNVARERVRWFPALVSNHVMDLVSRYKPEELPPSLVGYVRGRGGYDYLHHCEVGSSNAEFVTDEVVDRFCLLGSPEKQIAKLERLAKAGVTQFNIYLMCGDEEQTLLDYERSVIPKFQRKSVSA
jgi:probable F420-dependent oxidoreductase